MKKTLAFAIAAQAVSIIILLVLSLQFFKQLNALSDYTDRVEHTYLVIYQLAQVRSQIKDAETSSRGYILTGRPAYLKMLSKPIKDFFPAMDSLRSLVKENDVQMGYIRKAERRGYDILRLQLENARNKRKMTKDSLEQRLEYGRAMMEQMEADIESMKSYELVLLKERSKIKRLYEDRLPRDIRTVFFIAGFLTLVFGLWIFLELKKRFRFQALLQKKLMELRQNNEELEQIAFAASHDLQEPLRKIRIFSDRLLMKTQQNEDKDSYLMSQRINLSASKLQELIGDLVTFNTLVQNKFAVTQVILNDLIDTVLSGFSKKLNEIEAEIINEDLPVVVASHFQLKILFQHLLGNSIQFRNASRRLQIKITSDKVLWSEIKGLPSEITEGYFYHIKIIDNGIGFDETFKGKMFKPFQRLHNYKGDTDVSHKGMGLAICKRIMLNSGGWIDAEGRVEFGTTIHLYFPAG